jgi:hypothetical protein
MKQPVSLFLLFAALHIACSVQQDSPNDVEKIRFQSGRR